MLCQSHMAREMHNEHIHSNHDRLGEWFEVVGGEVITHVGRLVDLIGLRALAARWLP